MKLIIAGDWNYSPSDAEIDEAVKFALGETYRWGKPSAVDEVLSGKSSGVDASGEKWADRNKIKVKVYSAEYDDLGSQSFTIEQLQGRRNKDMAKHGDVLVTFWDGADADTSNLINQMLGLAKQVYIFKVRT